MTKDQISNPSSERNLISICLKNADRIIDVQTAEIFPEHFYVQGHKHIFMSMIYLYSKKIKPSPLSIMEVLTSENAKKAVEELGGTDYLLLLEESHIPQDNLTIFINKIKQSHTRRTLINISEDVINFAKSDNAEVLNPSELIGFVESKITDLSVNLQQTEEVYKMGDKTEDILQKRADNPSTIPGLQSGFEEFDKLTNGGQAGDLIIVCAESKTGKSVLLTNIGTKIAIDDCDPILYIDTEMNEREQEDRILSNLTGIPVNEIISGLYVLDTINGKAEDKVAKLKEAREKLKLGNYYHIYMPQFSAEKVTALARKFQVQFGIKALFFDYIKIPASQGNFKSTQEYQALGFFTSSLKDIAGILKIPVYSACQMNRDAFGKDNEPDAGRIGGSYRILQLATKLIFLTNKSEKKIARDGIQNGNQQLWIKYQRNGQSDCPPINIFFDKPILRQKEIS